MTEELLVKAIDFIRSIGIEVEYTTLQEGTFLPGLLIDKGRILVDRALLKYPGDILHEAGHIASVPVGERSSLNGETIGSRENNAAEEMMAIAWSYAACKHLSIDPYFVFHEDGYQKSGHHIADEFEAGHYFGVPMLQWAGMTAEPHQAETFNMPAFPAMTRWVREA